MTVAAGSDVDIVPQRAGKGRALEFLLKDMRAAGMEPEEGVQVIQHTHTPFSTHGMHCHPHSVVVARGVLNLLFLQKTYAPGLELRLNMKVIDCFQPCLAIVVFWQRKQEGNAAANSLWPQVPNAAGTAEVGPLHLVACIITRFIPHVHDGQTSASFCLGLSQHTLTISLQVTT